MYLREGARASSHLILSYGKDPYGAPEHVLGRRTGYRVL